VTGQLETQAGCAVGLPSDNIVLPFQVSSLGVRGRLVRTGNAVDDVIRRHDYPEPVAALLAEAVALTSLLGASLKFEGKFIFQIKTDGPVNFLVVDYTSPGKIRGLAHYDNDKIAGLRARAIHQADLLGSGHLAMTIDQGADMERYQGVVALDNQTLSGAAETYFRQSEQIPSAFKLAAGPVAGRTGQGWRAGGILIQHLPEQGGGRHRDLAPGDVPKHHDAPVVPDEDDNWVTARSLLDTVEDHELLDPTLRAEALLYRLYHEPGVRIFSERPLEWHCRCSRERITEMLSRFNDDDRAHMVKDGVVTVTCEFCFASYTFAPEEIG
jgi:molecular chaperone Hsp33